ncbi:MAG: HAD-IA family hydrolase [Thiohalospira sp.]
MAERRLMIFDWDGTLMDSEARIVAAMQGACRDLGLEVPDRERACDVIGLGLAEALRRLVPDLPDHRHAEMAERYRHYYLEADDTPTPLFAGVPELLQGLESAGHLLAVATGKGRAGLDRALADSGLAGRFHATRTAEETRSKPHPQMLEELLEFTGCEPGEAVMVGDTEYDLLMARNAGMPAVGVTWGVHHPERLRETGPEALVSDMEELARWLHGARWEDESA